MNALRPWEEAHPPDPKAGSACWHETPEVDPPWASYERRCPPWVARQPEHPPYMEKEDKDPPPTLKLREQPQGPKWLGQGMK